MNLTGILGSSFARPGQIQLGAGPSGSAVLDTATVGSTIGVVVDQGPWKRLVDTITVSPSIVLHFDRVVTVTSNVSVTPAIDPLSSSARVTQVAVDVVYRRPRDETITDTIIVSPAQYVFLPARVTQVAVDVVYTKTTTLTVTDTVAVNASLRRNSRSVPITVTDTVSVGHNEHVESPLDLTVTDSITVASSPFGRNTNVRIGVTTSIGVGVPTTEGTNQDPQFVQTNIFVNASIHLHSNSILLPLTDAITVTPSFRFYVSPVRISLMDLIAVNAVLSGGPSSRPVTVTDRIAVATDVNPKRPVAAITDAIVVSLNGAGGGHFRNLTVSHTVFMIDTIADRSSVKHTTVIDTITVQTVRFARGPFVPVTVQDAIVVGATIVATSPKRTVVNDSIAVGSIIQTHVTPVRMLVTDNLTVREKTHENFVSETVTDTVTVSTRLAQFDIDVFSRIVVDSNPRRVREAAVSDSLTVTTTDADQVIRNVRIVDNLPIIDTTGRQIAWKRSITDQIVIPDVSFPKTIWLPNPITMPVAVGTLVTNYTVLQSKKGAIVLPAPLLGDGLENVDSVFVHRSMNGNALVFKQSSLRQKLRFMFRLDQLKAWELRLFVEANISQVLTLTTFDAQVWVVTMTKNPFEIQNAGRGAQAGEFSTVEIELEGTKTSG